MHPALCLPHVLDQIAAQFSDRHSVEDDHTLQALALVNHAFSDAALSQVWDDTYEDTLVERMSGVYEHVDIGEDGKPHKVLIVDLLGPCDLRRLTTSRFTFYSRRVRRLRCRLNPSHDSAVDTRITSAWAANLSTFFPHLSVLDVSGYGVCTTPRLEAALSLLSPQIKEFVLQLGFQSGGALDGIPAQTMGRFHAACSGLLELCIAVYHRGGTPKARKNVLSGFVVASPGLQSADFTCTDVLNYKTFLHLAALPDLRYLDVGRFRLDSTAPTLPTGSFPRLDKFRVEVRSEDTHVAQAFLALPPTGHLRKFSFMMYGGSSIPANVFTLIVRALRPFRELTVVKICPFLSPEEVISIDRAKASWEILEPLSALPVLQELHILGTLPFVISEERLLKLAASWPRLEYWEISVFHPGPPPGMDVYMRISLGVLLEVLRRCVAVEHLPYLQVIREPLLDEDELAAFVQQGHGFKGSLRVGEDDEGTPLVQTLRRVLPRAEVHGNWN